MWPTREQFWCHQVAGSSSCSPVLLRDVGSFDSHILSRNSSFPQKLPAKLDLGARQLTKTILKKMLSFFRAVQSPRVRRGAQSSLFLLCGCRTRDHHVSVRLPPELPPPAPLSVLHPTVMAVRFLSLELPSPWPALTGVCFYPAFPLVLEFTKYL